MKIASGRDLPDGWRPGMPLPRRVGQVVQPVRARRRPVPKDDQWVVWDDLCQTIRADGLQAVAGYLDHHGLAEGETVCIRLANGSLRAANKREMADLVSLIE